MTCGLLEVKRDAAAFRYGLWEQSPEELRNPRYAFRTFTSPRLSARGKTQYRSTKLDDGYPSRGLCVRRGGDADAWVFSRVLRRTDRAQGASSGSTILVFVVQITGGGAAGTHARSSAALPRAICCQAYSLKSRVPVERGAGGGDRQPAK
jgi:hypothetical protein